MTHSPATYHGSRREGIDFTTLAITAAASAAAAYITSKLWAPGTLPAAAATPVLVAIIREGLQKPTEVVARAVPVRGIVRSAEGPDPPASEPPPPRAPEPEAPTRVVQPGLIAAPSQRWDQRWRLAIITGLLGFLVAAVVLTVPELVAGGPASGDGGGTTLFGGGKEKKDSKREREQEPTTTARGRTVTTPGRTVTVPPPATRTAPTTTTQSRTQTVPPTATTTGPLAPAPDEP
jgi:hypothetical protein